MIYSKVVFLLLFTSLLLLGGCFENHQSPQIDIQKPYAFATIAGARTGAAFMQIQNNTDIDHALIDAHSDIAEITEIHQNIIDPDDGMMMMRKIKQINIPAKEQINLEPKGYHIMFIGLNRPLIIGESISVSLTFEHGIKVTIPVHIIAPGTIP